MALSNFLLFPILHYANPISPWANWLTLVTSIFLLQSYYSTIKIIYSFTTKQYTNINKFRHLKHCYSKCISCALLFKLSLVQNNKAVVDRAEQWYNTHTGMDRKSFIKSILMLLIFDIFLYSSLIILLVYVPFLFTSVSWRILKRRRVILVVLFHLSFPSKYYPVSR